MIHNFTDSDYLSNYQRNTYKNSQENTTVHRFLKAFNSIHRGKMEQILLTFGLPIETVTVIMMLFKNTKGMVHSLEHNTDFFNFFDLVTGVLQGDISVPYMFLIYYDYVLWVSINLIKENGFTLKEGQKQTISCRNYNRCRLHW